MRRKQVDHFTVAALCRANPGEWQDVGEYNSSQCANGIVGVIRRAYVKDPSRRSAYVPVGAFEARHSLTEFGAMVQARFVGSGEDAAWSDAVAALAGGAA